MPRLKKPLQTSDIKGFRDIEIKEQKRKLHQLSALKDCIKHWINLARSVIARLSEPCTSLVRVAPI